jgi:hypothetical protein
MKQPAMISMCDKTGIMALPWAEGGYTCICVDIQHSIRATKKRNHKIERFEGGGEIHFVFGDARSWTPLHFDEQFFQRYYLAFVACFPVCTNVAGSGSQDYSNKRGRPMKDIPLLIDALSLFNSCEQIASWSGAPYMCENPVGVLPTHHRKPNHYFQPWNYGDLWTKKTCLWTGNGFIMPKFIHETEPPGVVEKIWLASPGASRQDERSETPEQFARAVFESNNKIVCQQTHQ